MPDHADSGLQDMGHDHDHPSPPGAAHEHDGDDHDHASEMRSASSRRLVVALGLTVSFMIVEVVAGLASGSLALLSDAGHMLTDAGALALALYAQALAARTRTGQRTFGFRRAEILAALINGIVLGVSAFWVIVEAVRRFNEPPEVQGLVMLAVATVGLGVNLVAAFVLSRGVQNVNVRAAVAHVLADAAGSVAAIVAGALILWLGWSLADPLASIAISILILVGAWRLVRESVNVLMEGVPAGIDMSKVDALVRATPGVADVHDLHVWSVSDGFPIVTLHVVLSTGFHGTDVARAVAGRLEAQLGIAHATVQPESPAPTLVPVTALVGVRGDRDEP